MTDLQIYIGLPAYLESSPRIYALYHIPRLSGSSSVMMLVDLDLALTGDLWCRYQIFYRDSFSCMNNIGRCLHGWNTPQFPLDILGTREAVQNFDTKRIRVAVSLMAGCEEAGSCAPTSKFRPNLRKKAG